jgi:hypothetical protein
MCRHIGNGGKTWHILYLGSNGGEWLASCPGSITPRKEIWYTFDRRLWTPWLAWKLWKEKYSATLNLTPVVQPNKNILWNLHWHFAENFTFHIRFIQKHQYLSVNFSTCKQRETCQTISTCEYPSVYNATSSYVCYWYAATCRKWCSNCAQ